MDPVGIRPNRHSLTVPRLNNSGVHRATETCCRLPNLFGVRFACNDQRPVGTLRTACALPWTCKCLRPGQRLRHWQSATGSPKHGKDNQRLFRLELSLGLLRDNIGCNRSLRNPGPSQGHSRQPVGVGDCVPNPANLVSTQSRNRTRAHPCSRYSLSPWREPGNST